MAKKYQESFGFSLKYRKIYDFYKTIEKYCGEKQSGINKKESEI